jgi:peptidoglycan/LPS O-acetylase OafA/YrhL
MIDSATMEKRDGWGSAQNIISYLLTATLPRFMFRGGLRQGKKERHGTSYLDAMRGYAAFAVVNHHKFAYKNTWVFRLPFTRLLCSGVGATSLFFVISGYVLSYQLLQLMRTRNGPKLFEKVSSALFRRYIRLYLSSAIATFLSFILVRLNMNHVALRRYHTFFDQFAHWLRATVNFSNPFREVKSYYSGSSHGYLDVLWTIPLEFRASLLIYIFCIATSRLTYRNRSLVALAIIALSFWWNEFFAVMFLFGLLIADHSISRSPQPSLPQSDLQVSAATARKDQSRKERIFFSAVTVFALFVMGYISGSKYGHWPWNRLYRLIPEHTKASHVVNQFWPGVGAVLLVWAVDSYPALQTPLKWDFSQYLGDLSFGIYVMHLLVINSIYDRVLVRIQTEYLGRSVLAYVPTTIIYWTLVLWAADLFSRIDNQVVLFARWLERKLFTVKLDGS